MVIHIFDHPINKGVCECRDWKDDTSTYSLGYTFCVLKYHKPVPSKRVKLLKSSLHLSTWHFKGWAEVLTPFDLAWFNKKSLKISHHHHLKVDVFTIILKLILRAKKV